MNIAPIKFKEFSGDAALLVSKPAKPFLPGGRFRGEVPPPPPAPSYTEEQLKAAERDAYKKGFLEGTDEGRKQAESEQTMVQQNLESAMTDVARFAAPLFADYRNMAEQLKSEMPKISMAIARKIAGAALSNNVQASVEDIVTRCVSSVLGTPSLVVTVHDSLAGALEQKLALLASQSQETSDITVMKDASMNVSDCRIEWKNGEFVRNTSRLWQEIERAVETLTVSAKHDISVQMAELERKMLADDDEQPKPTKE